MHYLNASVLLLTYALLQASLSLSWYIRLWYSTISIHPFWMVVTRLVEGVDLLWNILPSLWLKFVNERELHVHGILMLGESRSVCACLVANRAAKLEDIVHATTDLGVVVWHVLQALQ